MQIELDIIALLNARKTGTWEDLSMWLSVSPEKIKPIVTKMLRSKKIFRTDRKIALYSGGEGYLLVPKKVNEQQISQEILIDL